MASTKKIKKELKCFIELFVQYDTNHVLDMKL